MCLGAANAYFGYQGLLDDAKERPDHKVVKERLAQKNFSICPKGWTKKAPITSNESMPTTVTPSYYDISNGAPSCFPSEDAPWYHKLLYGPKCFVEVLPYAKQGFSATVLGRGAEFEMRKAEKLWKSKQQEAVKKEEEFRAQEQERIEQQKREFKERQRRENERLKREEEKLVNEKTDRDVVVQ